jgi:hypothetical protein
MKIVHSPGVEVMASPITNASTASICSLASHQQIPIVTNRTAGPGGMMSSNLSYQTAGWKLELQPSVNPASSASIFLTGRFTSEGFATYSKDLPDTPQISTIEIPFDGIVPLGRFYLLGTIDLTTASPNVSSNALAVLIKVDRNPDSSEK